jgi:hypothetical protein
LRPEECNVTEDGVKEDVCIDCAQKEKLYKERKLIMSKKPKAFDEWWIKSGGPVLSPGVKIAADVYRESKFAWKAALKWVLQTAKEIDEQDAPICTQEVIEQELLEE